jgi:hypothetical protein
MIVVEAGHEIFAAFMWTINFCCCHCHFLCESTFHDEDFIYSFKINDWIQKYWVVLQPILKILSCFALKLLCVNAVYSLIHIILMFFTWSGNDKFYILFLRIPSDNTIGISATFTILPCTKWTSAYSSIEYSGIVNVVIFVGDG